MESGIDGGAGRAPVRASGQAVWIRNLLMLSQNAFISVTAHAVNIWRTWTSRKRKKGAPRDRKGYAKERAGITKDTKRTTSTFRRGTSIFGQASDAACLPTSSLGLSTES
jgi:hypothetical protein